MRHLAQVVRNGMGDPSDTAAPASAAVVSALSGAISATDLKAALSSTYDAYYVAGGAIAANRCTIQLFDLATNRSRWSTIVPNCTSIGHVAFHSRSFMGDRVRDFTAVITANTTESNTLGYWRIAGDGATGEVRSWRF